VFPDQFNTDKRLQRPKTFCLAQLNCHRISIQGILGLETRKFQQHLNLFDLGAVCLYGLIGPEQQ
jgi:hypothetical protein